MNTNLLTATYHGFRRAKERLHIKNIRAASRQFERACERGKRAEDFDSMERAFLAHEGQNGCFAVAYGGFCYIVSEDGRGITVYPLPSWFGKAQPPKDKQTIRALRTAARAQDRACDIRLAAC